MSGEAAVPRITGKNWIIAEIFAAAAAKAAEAASAAQPRHPHSIADPECLHARPYVLHPADNFVTRHDRQAGMWQFPVNHMQIGAANPAGRY